MRRSLTAAADTADAVPLPHTPCPRARGAVAAAIAAAAAAAEEADDAERPPLMLPLVPTCRRA